MKPRMALKIIVDIAMTVALMFLMTYELIGRAIHEWIGVFMLVLFLFHHALNVKWSQNVLKGRYTSLRLLQLILVAGSLVCMMGSMISGVVLSEHVFAFLSIRSGQSWARTWHLLCSYWGFVMMSLHLGFHWSVIMVMIKKHFGESFRMRTWILRTFAAGIAVYGDFAFEKREIGSYMLRNSEFVFFDFEEPLVFFFIDYITVMGLFVFIGHYLAKLLKYHYPKRKTL